MRRRCGMKDEDVIRILKDIRRRFREIGELEEVDFYFENLEYHVHVSDGKVNEWYDCFICDEMKEVQGDE